MGLRISLHHILREGNACAVFFAKLNHINSTEPLVQVQYPPPLGLSFTLLAML